MNALQRAKPDVPEGTRSEGAGRPRRKGPVRLAVRAVLALILLAAVAGTGGFLYFAETVAALEAPRDPKADAIVVIALLTTLTARFTVMRTIHEIDLIRSDPSRTDQLPDT